MYIHLYASYLKLSSSLGLYLHMPIIIMIVIIEQNKTLSQLSALVSNDFLNSPA